MKKLTILFISILATVLALSAQPRRSKSQVANDRHRTSQQMKQTKQKINLNERQLRTSLNNLEALNADIATSNKKIKATERSIDSTKRAISSITDTIEAISSDVAKLTDSAKKSLREARKRRQSMTEASMVLSAESFSQASKRLGYLKELDKSLARKTRELKKKKDLLAKKQEDLDKLRQKQTHSLALLEKQRKKLMADQEEANDLVADLRSQGKSLERELAARQKKAIELDDELDRIIAAEAEEARLAAEAEAKRLAQEAEEARLAAEAEAKAQAQAQAEAEAKAQAEQRKQEEKQKKEEKKKKDEEKKKDKKKQEANPAKPTPHPDDNKELASNSSTSSSSNSSDKASSNAVTATKLTGTFAQNKGKLLFPAAGDCKVVGLFGRTKHNDFTKVEVQNSGIDIQAPSGGKARAVFDGTVSSIFFLKGYNNIVMVRHGEYITVYANVDKLSVRKGDQVKAGQELGKIYADPDDGGRSILHFEVRKEREKLDPLAWIKQ